MDKFFIFSYAMALLFGCIDHSTSLTPTNQQRVTNEVTATLLAYNEAIKQNGLMAEFEYLDHSADFFWVPPGYTSALSYDSVAKILKYNAPLLLKIDNSFDHLRIIPHTPELATYTGTLRSATTDTTGKTTITKLLETGLLIKRKNGWKLLSGQTAILP